SARGSLEHLQVGLREAGVWVIPVEGCRAEARYTATSARKSLLLFPDPQELAHQAPDGDAAPIGRGGSPSRRDVERSVHGQAPNSATAPTAGPCIDWLGRWMSATRARTPRPTMRKNAATSERLAGASIG